MTHGRIYAWLLVIPATALVVLALLWPVLSTFGTTFQTGDAGFWSNYTNYFASGFRRTVLWRTFEVACIVTVLSVMIGFAAAWVVAKTPGRLKSLLIIAAVFPLLTGVVVRSFAWMVILGKNGMLNNLLISLGFIDEPVTMLFTKWAVIAAMVYLFVPLMILTLAGVLEGIPQDLTEASASLGATPGATFRQVVLPMAVPGLIVGSVLVFTGSFTSYATPQLLGGGAQMMMGTFLYQEAMVNFNWTRASTIAAIMTVVTLVCVWGMSKLAQRLNPVAG